jgi:hypothetical protein
MCQSLNLAPEVLQQQIAATRERMGAQPTA